MAVVGEHKKFEEPEVNITNILQLQIEGNYSDYAIKWDSLAMATVFDTPAHPSTFSSFDTLITYIDINNNVAILRVSDGAIISENANWIRSVVMNQTGGKSIYGKYVAFVNAAQDTLRIMKDGVLLKTVTVTDVNDDFYGAIVSKTGRYIAMPWWDNSEVIYKMRCYEGV